MLVLLVLLAGVGLMTACGGSATPATTTQTSAGPMTAKGTYTVPVQVAGSNGLATQTLNLTLTVQ
jgi:hypothetical protein